MVLDIQKPWNKWLRVYHETNMANKIIAKLEASNPYMHSNFRSRIDQKKERIREDEQIKKL